MMTIRNMMVRKTTRCLAVSGAAAALSFAAFAAQAQELKAADPTEKGDGTLSPAAAAMKAHGPLPVSGADVAAKAAANRAREEAEKSGAKRPFSAAGLAPSGGARAGPSAPSLLLNVPGLTDNVGAPPDTTGAIGPSRYIQLVNDKAGIFNRTTGALIGSGTLDQLANISPGVFSTDPQVIWDPATNRFYYTAIFIFSDSDNRLGFGFSKTSHPNNVTTDWCHYTMNYGSDLPDFPKLGDSEDFLIIGVNRFSFDPNFGLLFFFGSDLIAISKPEAEDEGKCPEVGKFKVAIDLSLVDSSGNQVSTPVPANQIDPHDTGFVVARNGALPSTTLWFFNVTKGATGFPVFGPARGVTVGTYAVPPNASQPGFTQVLDTLFAQNTQAVQAFDPRTKTFSFWTQHTIANGNLSAVRWYEIDPVPATPVVLRSGDISDSTSFYFNAAISPDRRRDGDIRAFGDSLVIDYNVSGSLSGIFPRIVAASSIHGGPLSSLLVIDGVGPYISKECPNPGDTCRWGDYSGATPDPRPRIAGGGVVWGTNQFSGLLNPPANDYNWRTQIFELRP
jgi:hypothetical protein